MKDLDLKNKVLDEIMNLMDEREGESLKAHPKFMAAKVEMKPEDEESPLEESKETPEMEKSEDDLSPEDLQMLMEKLKGLS